MTRQLERSLVRSITLAKHLSLPSPTVFVRTHLSNCLPRKPPTQRQPYELQGIGDQQMGKRKRASDTSMMKTVTTLLLFTLIVVTAQDPQADTNALSTFRDTFDPSGRLLKWSNSTATCSWQGILCYNNRVVGMRLPGVGLRGIIPPSSLGLLTELRIVSLHKNHLTGPFPGELGKCTHVHSLYLGHNDFYGPLPDLTGFWPRLTHLSLEYNRQGILSCMSFVFV